ncbi:dephospho-CoA kinase-domain-containing protein [Leucosporidium creatinivorum]|uniref:Dephospho-CoA kinase-domain-containing protein n=1 Tax=Leucosporidium creatinivorum TaxID=106004 RepID=A0A1Y2FWL9_9BASI|nr:dephospho-CoA kinase-domain-containing protein [Leucosporidium creatinivorum]
MLVVGLTGGIASGKSTVSSLLKSQNIPLIDLDILARQAVAPNSYALSALVSHFGDDILHPSGELNREKLGSIIFGNEKERRVLNSIVHPAVRRLLAWELVKCWFRGEKVAVVDAPLLIEAGLWKMCGAIVVVYCSETLQLQRLQTRNSLSVADARARLSSQAPLSSKLVYADYVIDNSGPKGDLDAQVVQVVTKLHAKAGWSWLVSWLLPPVGLLRGVLRVGWRLWVQGVGKERRTKHGTRGEKKGEEIELKERRSRNGSGRL